MLDRPAPETAAPVTAGRAVRESAMIKRIVTFGALVPLLVLLAIWAHANAERMQHRTDQVVCKVRPVC